MGVLHVVSLLFLVELATAITRTMLVAHTLEASVSNKPATVCGKAYKAPRAKTNNKPIFSRRGRCSLVISRTGRAKMMASVMILVMP